MWMGEKLDAVWRNSDWSSQQKSADRVRRDDDRDKRQKGIIDKGAAVNRDLIKTKRKGNKRGENCMEAKEGGEGDEYANGKSKRRSLRWIVQREQTAESRAEHILSSSGFRVCEALTRNPKPGTSI